MLQKRKKCKSPNLHIYFSTFNQLACINTVHYHNTCLLDILIMAKIVQEYKNLNNLNFIY